MTVTCDRTALPNLPHIHTHTHHPASASAVPSPPEHHTPSTSIVSDDVSVLMVSMPSAPDHTGSAVSAVQLLTHCKLSRFYRNIPVFKLVSCLVSSGRKVSKGKEIK